MNNQGYRINGGVGFSIKEPSINLVFEESDYFSFTDNRQNCLNKHEVDRLLQKLETIYSDNNLSTKMSCTVNTRTFTHYGFGTSTSIRLACVEALSRLNGREFDKQSIINLSGRGGTSGIGINTYFDGGLIFDSGVRREVTEHLLPSSAREDRIQLPLVVVSSSVPNWTVGILVPHDIKAKTEIQEVQFFRKATNIAKDQLNEILYEVVFGVVSSIKESDIDTFCKSIKTLQHTAWKKAERDLYGEGLINYERMLYDLGASCVGMSSLGPSLFFIATDHDFITSHVKSNNLNCEIIFTELNNSGRLIEHG